ncbi:phosphoenolpyruvate synthase, partial [Patescibacteria group bacterium]|nr:phosphoenolpyruvate synthase [Patescibacteria group bacterium]
MFIKTFKQLTKKDVNIAGGKGASLGEMLNNKIPVPPGFVVLAGAFDRFLQETDLAQEIEAQLEKVNYNDVNSVDRASNVIRDLIHDAKTPEDLEKHIVGGFKKMKCKLVAVRSSATAEDSSVASWAGELESYLNTTEKTLLYNVKKCWSSLFTPRAIFYRREKDLLDTHVSVAVVVQEMVESEISGITFTVHPVTQDKNQMIIEAGWGLGEAIVSGSITPDSYVIKKFQISNNKSQTNPKFKIQNSKQLQFEIIDINVAEQKKQIVRWLRKGVKWVSVPKSKREKQ